MSTGLAKQDPPQAGEEAERVEAGVDRQQVGGCPCREQPRGHIGRRLHAGHLGRTGAKVDPRKSGPSAIGLEWEWAEAPVAQVLQDAHLAGQFVRDHEIEPAAARRSNRLNIGDALADRQTVTERERKGVAGRIAPLKNTSLKKTVRVPSPALRTTRSSRPSPLRSAVTRSPQREANRW